VAFKAGSGVQHHRKVQAVIDAYDGGPSARKKRKKHQGQPARAQDIG